MPLATSGEAVPGLAAVGAGDRVRPVAEAVQVAPVQEPFG
jgi:hypothetical protein